MSADDWFDVAADRASTIIASTDPRDAPAWAPAVVMQKYGTAPGGTS